MTGRRDAARRVITPSERPGLADGLLERSGQGPHEGENDMERLRFSPALPVSVAVLLISWFQAARAQQDPPLFPETPAAPAATPAPAASPAPAATPAPAASPAPTATPAPARPAAPPQAALRPALDYARWQEMSPRERQTFVEGSIQALGWLALSLRSDLTIDTRVPPETLASIVKMIDANYPTRPAAVYLREMDSIYLTPEGQKLSMPICFQQAFQRANRR